MVVGSFSFCTTFRAPCGYVALDIAPASRESKGIPKQTFLILRALTTACLLSTKRRFVSQSGRFLLHGNPPMPCTVRGFYNNNPLALTCETAKEAFAKAIEWHVVEKLSDISISDGLKSYTIAEFSLVMALNEISSTLDRER